jgi:hypothetical protein
MLFSAVLDELIQAPAILALEDIHWADEATLDLLRWSRWRRLHQARAMRSHYRRRDARHGRQWK